MSALLTSLAAVVATLSCSVTSVTPEGQIIEGTERKIVLDINWPNARFITADEDSVSGEWKMTRGWHQSFDFDAVPAERNLIAHLFAEREGERTIWFMTATAPNERSILVSQGTCFGEMARLEDVE